jgi:hypothetical protein
MVATLCSAATAFACYDASSITSNVWADQTGRGNDLTIYGSRSVVGGALVCDGSTWAYRDSLVADFPSSALTILVLLRPSVQFSAGERGDPLFTVNRSPWNIENEAFFYMQNYWDYAGGYGFSTGDRATTAVPAGRFSLLGFVRSGTSGRYFLDGQPNGVATAAHSVSYGRSWFSLLRDYRDGGKQFEGSIKRFIVLSYAMSDAQMASLAATLV